MLNCQIKLTGNRVGKKNCWEIMSCGRGPGGSGDGGRDVCPAARAGALDGVHGGTDGGRACWVVAGTFCGGAVQGQFARKYFDCRTCAFYEQVRDEEKGKMLKPRELLDRLAHRAGEPAE
jgi:hypothetical protein